MDKITKTIQKLLRKAEGASTPAEAEAYSAKAEELMLKHSVDPEALKEAEATGDKVTTRRFTMGTYAKPKSILLGEIAAAFGARAFLLGGQSRNVVIHGWERDLDMIETLFESLERQAMSAASAAHQARPWVHGKTFTTSFLVGFARTVSMRLRARKTTVEREAEATTPGTTLVLVDRKAAVERAVAEATKNAKVRKATSSQVSSSAGWNAGQRAGERADLGGSRVGSASRTALR